MWNGACVLTSTVLVDASMLAVKLVKVQDPDENLFIVWSTCVLIILFI